MAGDFEDIQDVASLTDDELREVVRERLDEQPDLDPSGLDLDIAEGKVTLAGRVGTEAEAQIIEHVLTDMIGIEHVQNDLVVDELMRQTQPEAADEANERVYRSGAARGGADRTEDSAEHLLNDTAAEQYGTEDAGEAVERGHTYNPPDSPVQEGTWSREGH